MGWRFPLLPHPGLKTCYFPLLFSHTSHTFLCACFQGPGSSGPSREQQAVLVCWRRQLGPGSIGAVVIQEYLVLVERAELENRTRVSRRTGRGFYGTGTAAASCVPQLLCNTTSSCRPGESSPRMGFLAGQGQGSKELPSSSSALSGELSRVLWQTSNQDLWVSRYLLLLCPKFLLIWPRECCDLVLLTSAFG